MNVPILETGETIKRYRFAALYIPIQQALTNPQLAQFVIDENPYIERSLMEWSQFLGWKAELIDSNLSPHSIGWKPVEKGGSEGGNNESELV